MQDVSWLYEAVSLSIIMDKPRMRNISLITKATRVTDKTETLIDNIFTNNLEKINDSINGIVFSDISDHLPIINLFNTDIFVKNKNTNEYTVTYKREHNENNINAYPKKAFDTFLRLFVDAYETHFPLKRKQNK